MEHGEYNARMAAPAEIIAKFQADLAQYIKPREQVNYIRRILALHLGSCAGDGPDLQPLSLVDTRDANASNELRGIQKEYIEALRANAAARSRFEDALQAGGSENVSQRPPPSGSGLLDERIALLKLQQKRECLLAIQRTLDGLAEESVSAQSLPDAQEMFRGAAALPSLPKTVVDSLVAEQSSSQPDLQSRVSNLDRMVLRARLLLKQEERLLAEARARCRSRSDAISNGAKLEALNATRNELIGWIEMELGKASVDEPGEHAEESGHAQNRETGDDQAAIETQLGLIHDKYADYVAARKGLVALVSHHPQPPMPPPRQQSHDTERIEDVDPASVDYLLTPYIEKLLSVSRQQKAVITHKSHINSVLNKQSQNTCKVLDRLAEESQLVPSYPMKDSLRRRSGIRNEIAAKSPDGTAISAHIRPWVGAADAAKIATLENVAETIERGQIALENCMKTLHDIDHLLCHDSEATAEPSEEDLWLSEGSKAAGARKHSEKTMGLTLQKGDPWSRLHGNLGFIGDDDGA